MTHQETKYDQGRKELSINSMYFNRYLLIRYLTAGFFFVNLYWAVLMVNTTGLIKWLPVLLLIVNGAIAVEQVGKYWYRSHDAPVTKWGYWIQFLANIGILMGLATGQATTLFPFFATKGVSYAVIATIIGLLFSLLIERRVWLIAHDRDTYYQRIQAFVSSLN
ncbi:hypothetical protein [Lacticaseibacillus saniviri]|uniref:PTS cellobiose transporter subunit IIC n=2 Tax=Lacticaseibacillus saniviri TaxID=931533 RepID=A0A0R2MRI1_9LACO|nr:hypothetical protein [Lacticaseibacillus saniviri]KRO16212.1 hypothetical protein IV56_GL001701 [Lacticaseibacillus saniviri JCM 17471 = DSM 24301]MCG4281666.1 PTS cellobiose transporter subunit IIC [Lacticaseibacillus saniviri]